jgi:hypothetical protein
MLRARRIKQAMRFAHLDPARKPLDEQPQVPLQMYET